MNILGKKRIVESRKTIHPGISYHIEELERWLSENYREEGWEVNSSLSSQNSITWGGENTILNFFVFKYVEE